MTDKIKEDFDWCLDKAKRLICAYRQYESYALALVILTIKLYEEYRSEQER